MRPSRPGTAHREGQAPRHGFRNFDNYRLRLLLHCGVR
jgi:hypothetical protein